MPHKRKNFDAAVEMYQKGLSIANIANGFGVTRQAMWKILRRRNVKFRSNKKLGPANHFYRGGVVRNAHFVVIQAVRKGILSVSPCEVCGLPPLVVNGRQRIHGHHDDYNKLLEVRWLCKKHHDEWHLHNKAIPRSNE